MTKAGVLGGGFNFPVLLRRTQNLLSALYRVGRVILQQSIHAWFSSLRIQMPSCCDCHSLTHAMRGRLQRQHSGSIGFKLQSTSMNWGSRPLPGLGPGARIKMTKADGGHNCALARAARVRMSRLGKAGRLRPSPIMARSCARITSDLRRMMSLLQLELTC